MARETLSRVKGLAWWGGAAYDAGVAVVELDRQGRFGDPDGDCLVAVDAIESHLLLADTDTPSLGAAQRWTRIGSAEGRAGGLRAGSCRGRGCAGFVVGVVLVSARLLLALGQRRIDSEADAPAGDDEATDVEFLDLLAVRG